MGTDSILQEKFYYKFGKLSIEVIRVIKQIQNKGNYTDFYITDCF